MLVQENRLKDKLVIRNIFKTGRVTKTPFFNIYQKLISSPPQLLVVVSSEVSKSSVRRNLVKRRIRETFREILPEIDSSLKIIVVTQKEILEAPAQEIKKELKKVLEK